MSRDDALIDKLRIESRTPETGRRPAVGWVVGALVAVALAASAWFGWTRMQVPEVSVVQARVVETGGPAGRASVLDASGYVVARRQATVSAEVTGKLEEVLVEEGMTVEAGQLVARLDDATERAQLELSRAREVSARSALREIEVQLADAERTRARQRELHQRELVSQSELDRAETEVQSLRARLASRRDDIEVARREVELRSQLVEELNVRAPFGGVVVAKSAQPGEMVSPISAGGGFTRTGICTIVDMESLEIEVDVNESYIDRVFPGQSVTAVLDAYPDWRIPAEVTTVVPAADRQKATVRVRVGFLERDPRILPDMGISVRFLEADTASGDDTEAPPSRRLVLPAGAVADDAGATVVYVVDDGRVERRAVRTARRDNGEVVIVSGLNVRESVVADVAGVETELADGDRVKVVDSGTG